MYKLGDKVWVAFLESKEKWVLCQHCFGKCALTVILGDDSQVSIDCDCCRKALAKIREDFKDMMATVISWDKSSVLI